MTPATTQIGRAKTLLVFGDGDGARAVISTVVVHTCAEPCNEPFRFTGPVAFEESAARHLSEVVLPIVDRIIADLALDRPVLEISVANIGAASATDIGSRIAGFSTDVPVLLAALSAALQLPVPEDLVATGHVASPDGDVAMVKAIPAKLTAAMADPSIRSFVYPVLDRDASLQALSPNETKRAFEAITAARGRLRTIAVGNVADVLRAVFAEEAVVLASLRQGFFAAPAAPTTPGSPIAEAVRYLADHNEDRFWKAIEQFLLAGLTGAAQELLLARMRFHIRRRAYPAGFGARLLSLVRSLPPATRRIKITFPLIPMGECIALSQFATDADHEDVRHLIDASVAKPTARDPAGDSGTDPTSSVARSGVPTLDAILSEISEEALTPAVDQPINDARESYAQTPTMVQSFDEFSDTISAYYLHLLRHTRSMSAEVPVNAARADAFDLLEKAFAKRGGWKAARVQAMAGTNGGMPFVLDAMAGQMKWEERVKHVNRVFKDAIDPLDWDAKVALMAALLERLGPHLPPDLRSHPPETFAADFELIVQGYVTSMDRLKELLRRF